MNAKTDGVQSTKSLTFRDKRKAEKNRSMSQMENEEFPVERKKLNEKIHSGEQLG